MAKTQEELGQLDQYHRELLIKCVLLGEKVATSENTAKYTAMKEELFRWYGRQKALDKLDETRELLKICGAYK